MEQEIRAITNTSDCRIVYFTLDLLTSMFPYIEPNSISVSTGQIDRYSRQIYEKDIVRIMQEAEVSEYYQVIIQESECIYQGLKTKNIIRSAAIPNEHIEVVGYDIIRGDAYERHNHNDISMV